MRFGIVRFPGSCDEVDALMACERVGEAVLLWHAERDLQGVDAVVVPGGFSYGDYLRCGAIARFAPIMESVIEFARGGGLVLGICNGFQVLCEAGLLPGALLPNRELRFICRQAEVEVVNADTPFTREASVGQRLSIPIKHTTGRYHHPDLDAISDQVVLRYTADHNGSERNIAGVCNDARNVFGLMPHPEHAVHPPTRSTHRPPVLQAVAPGAAAGLACRRPPPPPGPRPGTPRLRP